MLEEWLSVIIDNWLDISIFLVNFGIILQKLEIFPDNIIPRCSIYHIQSTMAISSSSKDVNCNMKEE